MGTRNNAGECAALKLTFPSQVLPCSGSTGVISAFVKESTPGFYKTLKGFTMGQN